MLCLPTNMHKYCVVGLLLLAATQSSICFTDSRCQDDREGNADNIGKVRKSYREEIENTLKNGIGITERRVALSRYHSGTENSRIYKERNSEKERSGHEARRSVAFFQRENRIRVARANDEYTRQIREESRRSILSRVRDSVNRRTEERRDENSRRVAAETRRERGVVRGPTIRVFRARNDRDSESRRELHRRDSRDTRLDRRIDTGRSEDRRINNRLIRERANLRSVTLSERRDVPIIRQGVFEQRRTDVNLRRENSRRAANSRERVVRSERTDAENGRLVRDNERISQERNSRENRDSARRVRTTEREESRNNRRFTERERMSRRTMDAVDVRQPNREIRRISEAVLSRNTKLNRRSNELNRRFLENSRDRSDERSRRSNEAVTRDSRRFANFALAKTVAEEGRVAERDFNAERKTRANERFLLAKRQNNIVKYEGASFVAGFDIVKAVCIVMLVAQMASYGRSEKSKLSFSNILPSLAGWTKQKVD